MLLTNLRFYILATTILLSVLVASVLRLSIPNDQLFIIRTQQVLGLLCVSYWYVVMLISPIANIIGRQRLQPLIFSRRALGVSAAYFAALHGVIALFGQLGGPGEIGSLPSLFKWSLAGGVIALIILAAMAATSFDRVIVFMTPKRWKWLHRFVYLAGIAALLHIWTVGTHLAYAPIQVAILVAMAILLGLEAYRVSQRLSQRYPALSDISNFAVLFITIWTLAMSAFVVVPALIDNYHSRHANHNEQVNP